MIQYTDRRCSLCGVNPLTSGSKQEGRVTSQIMMTLGYQKAVELVVKEGSKLIIQAGVALIIEGIQEERMPVG